MKVSRWTLIPTLLFGLLLGLAACSAQRHDMDDMAHGAPAAAGRPVLYDSLGSYSYPITTASPETQRWFDQGSGSLPESPTIRAPFTFTSTPSRRARIPGARRRRPTVWRRSCPEPGTWSTCPRTSTGAWGATRTP